MSITIVIPNYNGKHLLEKNLPFVVAAAKEYREGNVDMVITDDNSTDDSVVFLHDFAQKEKRISITVVKNPGKRGFSCNVNNGVQFAKGELLLLLNTDAVPEKSFLVPLVRHFLDINLFAVGCLEKTTDEQGHPTTYGRSYGKFARGFVIHASADAFGSDKTFWVSCGSGLFRKTIWQTLGGLDELYNPFYWEDIDLSYRAVKSGYTIRFEKESVISHFHEEGTIKKNFSAKEITVTAYRNQIIFMWKNVTDTYLLIDHILWLPYYIFKTLMEGNTAFLKGCVAAVFLLPNVIQSRSRINKQFVLSDREVLESIKEHV